MKVFRASLICLGLIAAHAALADTNSNAVKMANGLNAPKVYTGIHPPQGTKASGFAPRPGNKSHTYGAPIQGPIFKSQPAKPAHPLIGNGPN